jgi:hypothetical protein
MSEAAMNTSAAVEAGELVIQSATVSECIADAAKQKHLQEILAAGDFPVFKGFAKEEEFKPLVRHLHQIMISSFEDPVPIRDRARNYMNLSFGDGRAPIPVWVVSWTFFSWNRDLFSMYGRYGDVYRLRNLMSGLPAEMFISRRIDNGFAARLAVYFYPTGKGFLGTHIDPVGYPYSCTATMVMNKRGRDFKTGGFYVLRGKEKRFIEDELEPGDLYFCNPACLHGVEIIDSDSEYDPMGSVGRWNMVFPASEIQSDGQIYRRDRAVS